MTNAALPVLSNPASTANGLMIDTDEQVDLTSHMQHFSESTSVMRDAPLLISFLYGKRRPEDSYNDRESNYKGRLRFQSGVDVCVRLNNFACLPLSTCA